LSRFPIGFRDAVERFLVPQALPAKRVLGSWRRRDGSVPNKHVNAVAGERWESTQRQCSIATNHGLQMYGGHCVSTSAGILQHSLLRIKAIEKQECVKLVEGIRAMLASNAGAGCTCPKSKTTPTTPALRRVRCRT
jgi:hypothetical protein